MLREVLEASGLNLQEMAHKHLIAEGADADFSGTHFQVSIPISVILDDKNEVILAYEMNEDFIPIDHGFPVRMIVPGHIGVRSCKWIHKIYISDTEAQSTMQQRDYKIIRVKDWANINYAEYPPIMGNVINSCITEPYEG